MHSASLVITIMLVLGAGPQALAAPLQVTELRGQVQQGARQLGLLDTLADGAVLVLDQAALLVAWDAQSDRRYVIAGPGKLTLGAAGPALAGGGSLHVLAPRRALPARPAEGSVMAGAVMRSVAPASMAQPALLPLALADFTWRNRPHLGDWLFRLYDDSGVLLHEAKVAAPRYRLPPALLLAPGQAYGWEVWWHDGNGLTKGALQSAQTMARQTVAWPAPDASAAERIGAALQLRDNGQLMQARQLAPVLLETLP